MPRYKMVNGVRIQFTAEEEKARDIEEQAWADGAPARRMVSLREQRNQLLVETDWYGMSDVTMDSDMTVYRQALRDITNSATSLDDVKWPEKP